MGYILVVDDEPVVRELLTETLRNIGHATREARHGREALDMVAEVVPEAIILDLNMPVLDGFMTLAHLQRKDVTRQIPVIVLTGLSNREHEVKRMPGVVAVLEKGSFDIATIHALLDDVGVIASS